MTPKIQMWMAKRVGTEIENCYTGHDYVIQMPYNGLKVVFKVMEGISPDIGDLGKAGVVQDQVLEFEAKKII